jgi:SAM-dependent methyltransferase
VLSLEDACSATPRGRRPGRTGVNVRWVDLVPILLCYPLSAGGDALRSPPRRGDTVLFGYCIDGVLAIGPPRARARVSRAPAGVLLRTARTFPASHPSTRLCLRLMLQALSARRCRTLADVGCGSGVLALAGLTLGVDRAVALDISRQAVITCQQNAALNGLTDRVRLVRGSADAIAGRFDLVLANLPLPVLTATLGELVRLSADDAALILSGFQDVDRAAVDEALAHLGLTGRMWLRADLTSFELPPSGSFTWMAVLARRGGPST